MLICFDIQAVNITSLKKTVFDLEQAQLLDKWLDFIIYDENSWNGIGEYDLSGTDTHNVVVKLQLVQKGGISIREYSLPNMVNYFTN